VTPLARFSFIHAAVVFSLLGACADSTDDPPTDADVTGETTLPPDGSTVGPSECPRNSAFPCTCDRHGECDDGSRCVNLPYGDDLLGFCSVLCDHNATPGRMCPESTFGSARWCNISESAVTDPTRCVVICAVDEVCPSDQFCVDPGIGGVPGYCVP